MERDISFFNKFGDTRINWDEDADENLFRPIEVSVVADHFMSFINCSTEFPSSYYGKGKSDMLSANTNALPVKSIHFCLPVEGKLYLLRSY